MSIKIALAGNPNSGKTTLFNNLTGSNQYVGNWPGVTVEKKEGALKGRKDVIIQDRTVMEGVNIFVANNYAQGNLSERDYNTFMDSYNVMMEVVKQPDLLIYLKSSIEHLVAQIAKRGRDYEQGISIEYLAGLNERYEEWIGNYTGRLITIDVDNLDFLNRPEDFALITDRIDAELYGLF